jgi:acetoacetyl-CoA synthetase
MTDNSAARPLWSPSEDDMQNHPILPFMQKAESVAGHAIKDMDQLHAWSIENREAFWNLIWDEIGVIGEKGERVLVNGDAMPGAEFFPDASLNFAENLLKLKNDTVAIRFRGEDKAKSELSWNVLHAVVSRLQQAMKEAGIKKGDRIAAMMPNMPETIAFMLAATSLGAVWSSCSPDFGERGVLDRFGQIEPKLFIACDGYWYNGKRIQIADKLKPITKSLGTKTIIVPYLGSADEVASGLSNAVTMPAFIESYQAKPVTFERVPFSHPLYILFSSGTTGVPKCIVHSTGGVLLQHLKELHLHCGLTEGDNLFYFTTCGWMMWNWLVSGLAVGATLCLFDGSPFAPGPEVLFDYCDEAGFAIFGTSAKYIDAIRKAGLTPCTSHKLDKLRMITSTGSPLAPENFDYVYKDIKADIHLASISGGTDIVSCFVLGIPGKPVWKGEIQGPGLGMAVDVWNDEGKSVKGEKGELVCTKPFPAMPVGFWNDPEGEKYKSAYFERFDNVWCHGDFAERTEHGGLIIHGRSDATLNPAGVRIGTAEIYNQVEQIPDVLEALAIGQDWDGDVRIILFVRLKDGVALDEELEKTLRTKIRNGASPRHVPAKIIAVSDIPRTKSGKIVELAVREVVHGREVKNKEALANPEALELFRNISALQAD